MRDAERRSWLFRYARHGKGRRMGLGPFPDVPLAEAREGAAACRRLLRDGVDPIERRRATRAGAAKAHSLTFREAAGRCLAANEAALRNEKHRYQCCATLEAAHAVLDDGPVPSITTGDATAVPEPIWRTKPETAERLRGRIGAVLDLAAAQGWRAGENPGRWRGHLSNTLPPPRRIARVEHHAALPWPGIPAFMTGLRGGTGTAARALEFTIPAAARAGEAWARPGPRSTSTPRSGRRRPSA